eukprot:CAMPEP_0168544014 /NCGR_PEP_ID=MMETSP0413-20121227/2198_1 /TAXON_ID=136452 /ORGANISM="Filamoeba nolandi, Strain NC-AS-23-1" /LENGTH=153 /DNA_ID=CAMNT_0008574015 /DNA_START=323 /DNA_END=781 /DNA_ORIENTATION=-
MLQKNRTPRSWINKQLKRILVGLCILILVIMTILSILSIIPGVSFINAVINGVFLVIIFAVTITMTVEGYRILKLLRNLEIASNSGSQEVVKTITKLVVGSSIALIIVMLVLLITTLIMYSSSDATMVCLISTLLYRIMELIVMCILTIPMRH